jgi:hypothetical protein
MTPALIASLFFTVTLLMTHGYFLLGSLPLLTLSHDTPLDARFVRGFFNAYYLAAFVTASATALSLFFAGKAPLAAGALALALLALVLRHVVIARMDSLRAILHAKATHTISQFRRLHAFAILINLVQIGLVVWGLVQASAR